MLPHHVTSLIQTWRDGDHSVGPILYDALEELGWPWEWYNGTEDSFDTLILKSEKMDSWWVASAWGPGYRVRDPKTTRGFYVGYGCNLTLSLLPECEDIEPRLEYEQALQFRSGHSTRESARRAAEEDVKAVLRAGGENRQNSPRDAFRSGQGRGALP